MADIFDQLAAEQDTQPAAAPEPAPPPVDLFSSFAAEQDQRQAGQDARLRTMFEAGLQKSPDERAGILEVARQSRLPADVVEQRFPEFKARAEAAKFDPAKFRAENPDLYATFLESPEAGRIALSDPKAQGLAQMLAGAVRVGMGDEQGAALGLSEEGQAKRKELTRLRLQKKISLDEFHQQMDAVNQAAGSREAQIVDPSADFSWWEKIIGKATVQPGKFPMGGVPGGTGTKRQPGVLEQSFRQGTLTVDRADLGREWSMRVLKGEDTWDLDKKIVDLENRMVPRNYGDDALSTVLSATGTLLPSQVETYKGAGPGAAVGAVTGAVLGAVTKTGVKAGAKFGYKVGGVAGGWLTSFRLEQGNAALDYRGLQTDDGQPVRPEVAVGWSIVYGGAAATVEVATEFGPVLSALGPVGDMIKNGTLKAEGRRLLKDRAFRTILADVAKSYAKGVHGEAQEEAVQQIIQDALGYIARAQTAGKLQSADVVGAVGDAAESYSQAALGTLLPGAGGAAVNLTSQLALKQAAQRGQAQLRAIAAGVESPTAQASPDFYAALVQRTTERTGEAVTAIYVDPNALAALHQDDATLAAGVLTPETEQAATDLMGPDGPQRLRDALAIGQKIEVPIAEFAERWRGKPIAEALQDHVAAKPFLPTASESAAQAEQTEAEAKALVDSIEKGEKAPAPEEEPLQQLAADLVKAGKMKPADAETDVKLWRKALNALAVRSGVELKDLVKSFVVRVQAEGGEPAATEQGAVPATPAFWAAAKETAQAKLDALRAEHGAEAESLPEWWKAQEDLQQATAQADAGRLEQGTPTGPRGWVTRVQNGLRNLFNVVLTDRANLSTFLHESGHVFMDILGELASRPGASPALIADWKTALKFMGVADRAELVERLAKVRQIRQQAVDAGRLEHGGSPALSDSEAAEVKALTAPFEKWARGFERYLMEGKAPSLELAGAFQRFKLWLRAIYRSVDALGVDLNPEIRGVFDRLLATDEEIARAQEEMGPTSLFRSPEEAGLQDKPEEWAAYLERAKKAVSAAQQAARQRAASQRLAVTEAWWKAERKTRRDAALEAYDVLPAVVALRFLRKGEAGGNAALQALGRVKLDRAAVVAILGEEGAKKLRGILAAEGGIDPGALAEIVAQGTAGEQLVQDIAALQPKTKWAEAQADDAMAREFPEVQTEREQLREDAGRALHGDAMLVWFLHEEQILRKRLAEAEGRTLQGMGAGSAGISAESVRRAAEILVDRMSLEKLDLGHFQGAERQAAQKAAVAAAKGDYGQALVHLQQRLLNFFVVRHLSEARDTRDELLDQGKQVSTDKARARLGRGSPALRDGVDRIVEALGLGGPFVHDAPLATLSAAVDAVADSGTTVLFDPDALAAVVDRPPAVAVRRNGEPGAPWRGLTVAQARNVVAALKNMRKAASSNLTALVDGKRMDFEELVARLVDEAQDNLPSKGPPSSSSMAGTLMQVAGGIVSDLDGELLRPETMLTWLGGKAKGIESWWYRAVVAPMQAAKVREADLLRETVAPIVDAMEAIPAEVKRRMRETVDGAKLFPDHTDRIQPISRRYELIALAQNLGNQGNIDRVLEGRNITMAQVLRAVGLLTRQELEYVQSCWDAAEKLGALSFEIEERLSGLAPEKVQAKPITITLASGEEVSLRGGYWPAVYDRRVEVKGEKQAADMTRASEFVDPGFARPGTSHSFLKSRVQGATGILSLDPTIVQSHLVQVAHDIAFREAVLSVAKLFLDQNIQDVLKNRLGEGRAAVFLDWVKDVARSRGATAVSQARRHTRITSALKSNMAVGALGYAADVVLGDLTNPAVAAVKFKNQKHLVAAIAECVAHPLETRRWAILKSGELRLRADELVRRWKSHRNELTKRHFPGRAAFDAYVEHAFDLFEMSDALTATPIWVGAYREGLELYDNDDDLAVEYADKLIRETFPTQSIVDQSAIQRDKGFWGASMLFFGYLNTIYNLRRDIAHDAFTVFQEPDSTGGERFAAVAKVAWKWIAVVAAYQVLGEFLSGRGKEPDEKFWQWLLRKALVGLTVNDLPFGALAEPTLSWMVTGKKRNVSVRAAPAVAVAQGAAESLNKAFQGKGDGKAFFDIARSLGLFFGVPTRPLRSAQYLATGAGADLSAGRLNELPAGVVYGERKGQPANPLRP